MCANSVTSHCLCRDELSLLFRFSLQDWNNSEVTSRAGQVSLEAEQQRREQVLDLRQALAREVTQRSKQVAGENRAHLLVYDVHVHVLRLNEHSPVRSALTALFCFRINGALFLTTCAESIC